MYQSKSEEIQHQRMIDIGSMQLVIIYASLYVCLSIKVTACEEAIAGAGLIVIEVIHQNSIPVGRPA